MHTPSPPPKYSPKGDPSIPPFLQQIPIDPTTTLAYIKTEISSIYAAAKIPENIDEALNIEHDRYLKIYTAVFDYCTTTKKSKSAGWAVNDRALYDFLDSEIQSYCKYMQGKVFGANNGDMDVIAARKTLATYMSYYRTFEKVSSLVRSLVRFWDRHCLLREWDLKKVRVSSVENLHHALWKEEVLGVGAGNSLEKKGLEELVDAVAVLRETEGGMSDYDLTLVKDVVKSLSVLDLTLES
jgi:hypothetical protein